MNILIIGGTNHIGPYMVKRLVERGDAVTVVNRGHNNAKLPAGTECLTSVRRRELARYFPGLLKLVLAGK